MSINKWLYKNCKQKSSILILTAFQSVLAVLSVYTAFILKRLVDSGITGNAVSFKKQCISLVVCIGTQLIIRVGVRYFSELSRATLENSFKENLLANIFRKNYQQVTDIHSEEWMNRLSNDCSLVANHLTDLIPNFVGLALRIIVAITAFVTIGAVGVIGLKKYKGV